MINIELLFDKIKKIPKDDTLYLLEKLPFDTGLFASNGNVLYLVSNEEQCSSMSINTEYLRLETNIFISAFNTSVSSFENGLYNSVELQLLDNIESKSNLSSFVNLCLAHATYMHGEDFMKFFDSLVALFQLPKSQQYKNLVGLMGELSFIEYVYESYGIDLSSYWHTSGTKSRLDFVCPFANFEVKTTTSDSLRVLIKHDQLFTNEICNYLVVAIIEENNSGRTLDDLISKLLYAPDYCNNMQFSVNIEKEKRRISPSDLSNKHFLVKNFMIYHASDINPFRVIPTCVEKLTYDIELSSFSPLSTSDFISLLK